MSLSTAKPRFIFFGTPEFSVVILDELSDAGHLPALIVTAPDRPRGRGMLMSPTPVRAWGEKHDIPVVTPLRIRANPEFLAKLRSLEPDCFIIAAYGKIIPQDILDIPKHGTLNVHPSLLPKFRGPSPIESFLLSDEKTTGVSIMLLDAEMDHGPIVAIETLSEDAHTMRADMLEPILAHKGGALLAKVLPEWVHSAITATPQNDSLATFTKKITKADGEINFETPGETNMRKLRAYAGWPGVYFFFTKNDKSIRIRITDGEIQEGKFIPTRIVPEGKQEMSYVDFIAGNSN